MCNVQDTLVPWSYKVKFTRILHPLQGGKPYNVLYREAPSQRVIYFKLKLYERVGISLLEVYEKVGKFVICNWVCEMAQNG